MPFESDIQAMVSSNQDKPSPMRFVLLGAGAVTTEFYLPGLYLAGRLRDAILVDPDAEQIRENMSAFRDVCYHASDYKTFLDELPLSPDKPECIIVALPNHLHADAVRRAFAKNRHVLCEKPLSLRASECAELKALAASRGRLLKVAMSRRYIAALRLTREIVSGGELGEVRVVDVHDRMPFMWRPRSYAFFAAEAGGVLADMGVHYLDYVETLVGPLTPLDYSDDSGGGNESSLRYRLSAPNNVQVNISLSRIHQTGGWLAITCSGGEVKVYKANENEAIVTPTGKPSRRIVIERPFRDPHWPSDFHGSFAEMLCEMEDAVAGKPTEIADVADAERTAALIEWAYTRRAASRIRPVSKTSQSRQVLVTGATGFIGGHLVERLTAEGLKVRATVRSPAKCANITRFPIDLRPTDLLNPASVRDAVSGVDTVYHLAYGNDGADPARTTIEGTRNVVEAAIAAGVDCVIILSTMYVFGFPEGTNPVDESFPYRPYGGEYGESKATIEKWCLERAKASGRTRIVVLNPTCVYGPGGGAYTCLPVDLARSGQFCWIDGGCGSANYIYINNLIDAMLLASETIAAHGERFILNDGTVTWKQLLGPFVDPLGIDIPSYTASELIRLPRYGGPFRFVDLFRAVVSATKVRDVSKRSVIIRWCFAFTNRVWPRRQMTGDPLTTLLPQQQHSVKGDPPVWLAQLYGSQRAHFSAEKAKSLLGWSPRTGLDEAQAETIAWLVMNGRLPDE